MGKWSRWAGATAAAVLLPVGAVAAQEAIVAVPIDVGQGAVLDGSEVTPYTASLKVQVARGLGQGGPLRIGPVGAIRYANPDWSVAGGLRAQWLVFRFGLGGRRWGAGLAAEQLWGTKDHRPGSLGLVADLELLRVGGWVVHDWSDERTGFEITLGTDLRSVAALLSPGGDPDPFPGID